MVSKRIYSIDILRGAAIVLMIVVNNPGSWGHLYAPLSHASWHGITATDCVFPFFLFVVGMSIGIVDKRLKDLPSKKYFSKVIKRSIIIFLIGLLLNYSPVVRWEGAELVLKKFEDLRILGVLQRIAFCYLFACIITRYCTINKVVIITLIIWLAYWLMFYSFSIDGLDPYSLEGYFGLVWDSYLLHDAHLYHGEGVPFDPEGLASTLPAIGNTLMGFVGYKLFDQYKNQHKKLMIIGLICVILLVIAKLWGIVFPFNKKIWTSSYALYTSALAMIWFLLFYMVFDLWRKGKDHLIIKSIGQFINVFGTNALFIYVFNALFVRFLSLIRWQGGGQTYSPWEWLFTQMVTLVSHEKLASFLCALIMLLLMWIPSYYLHKKRIFIKI